MLSRVLALSFAACLASNHVEAAAPKSVTPKLLVLLAVDQMRGDYVDWYGGNWRHGLHQLFTKGAWFEKAAYPYLTTVTCPGHATLGTGAYPRHHGMVLNAWYDRNAGRLVECTEDESNKLIAHAPPPGPDGAPWPGGRGDSGRNILIPTLGDELKAQLPAPVRVVGISWKARAAINISGHRPDLALWWENDAWVTSTAFTQTPVPWVERFVKSNPIDAKTPWTKLLPVAAYQGRDDVEGEIPVPGWTRSFPHAVSVTPTPGATSPTPRYGRWPDTPFVDQYLGRLAEAAVTELKLGQGTSTDLLAVSFSMTDVVGHRFGPNSHEVQDVLARLDVTLGRLFATLDRAVGKGKYTVALSADHGVAPLPEVAANEGKDAGRISIRDVAAAANVAVERELGPGRHVVTYAGNDVYLATGVAAKVREKPGAMARVLAALATVKGVAKAFDGATLADPAALDDPERRAAALSYTTSRSGDIVLAPKANWFPAGAGTSHGTTQWYDQHVPVVFLGAGVKPGKYQAPVSPADVAPTLGALVGVKLPKADGKPLAEAITIR